MCAVYRLSFLIASVLLSLCLTTETTDGDEPSAPQSARALVQRLLPDHGDRFSFETIEPDAGRDVFELEAVDGKVTIRGNNGVSMAMGLNWYLKHYCHCHVSWCGQQLTLPAVLPTVDPKVRQVAWAKHRYFLNYCCFGYSLPWYDWEQWERLIDWMALNGINMPLSVTGQEAIWQAVCKRMGMSDQEIVEFLAGPPYLPFQWMGCLDGWGGPLPASWIREHEKLAKQILTRQRELGMKPVLQGFTGHVPQAVERIYPDAKLHRIRWIDWETSLLDPLDPRFAEIAALWMEEQEKRFGTSHLYAADTFIEMTPPSGETEYLGDLGRAIYNGMAQHDPEAVWVLQTWIFLNQAQFWTQPRIEAFLGAVNHDQMLCLDLACENRPQWSRTEAFCGKPWLWCNIQNYGCTVFLGGALTGINTNLPAARSDPRSGQLIGLGFVNEGLDYNSVIFDLMYEMAWRDGPVDLDNWIADYATARGGRSNADAQAAWKLLLNTVYNAPQRTRSTIDHVPTLAGGRGGVPYSNLRLANAWRSLLAASDELGGSDAYRFDLVNLGRQVLTNHASQLHGEIIRAHQAGDADAFDATTQRFLNLIRDLDELLGTRREFLLGKWIADARRWGKTDAEKAQMEWNARRVISLWSGTTSINDYARKEWAGMLSSFYLKRWEWFLEEQGKALRNNEPFDEEAFSRKLREWMLAWSEEGPALPSEPSGDSVAISKRLADRYSEVFHPDALSLTTGKPTTCSHALPSYPKHLANDGHASDPNSFWATDVNRHPGPVWWQVDLEKPTTVGRVVVVGYYGDDRYYGFTVETSLDGKTWTTVADRRENKELSTAEGYTCTFTPRAVRYLRVTQPHNSANSGRHLVEVMAFEK